MPIDNQIASHRWRERDANSNHIPDSTEIIVGRMCDCEGSSGLIGEAAIADAHRAQPVYSTWPNADETFGVRE